MEENSSRQPGKVEYQLRLLKIYVLGLAVLWTLIVVAFMFHYISLLRNGVLELAMMEASMAFDKDIIFRSWATDHGGVYVPITERTPPNPYLSHIEERDITTPSGRRLTLVNPAYMTRQIHEIGKELFGHLGHITSLKPINPINIPDSWEANALKKFEQGESEQISVETIKDKEYMRLMRPLVTEERCLKCHAFQGYKVGDIRGGLSIAVPMEPYWSFMDSQEASTFFGHGVLWFLGILGIAFAFIHLKKRIEE